MANNNNSLQIYIEFCNDYPNCNNLCNCNRKKNQTIPVLYSILDKLICNKKKNLFYDVLIVNTKQLPYHIIKINNNNFPHFYILHNNIHIYDGYLNDLYYLIINSEIYVNKLIYNLLIS